MLSKKKKPTVTVVENKEKGNKKKTRRVVRNTAQDTIPYLEQYENGLYLIDREKGWGAMRSSGTSATPTIGC